MSKWGVIQAWNGSRLNPNGKSRSNALREGTIRAHEINRPPSVTIRTRNETLGRSAVFAVTVPRSARTKQKDAPYDRRVFRLAVFRYSREYPWREGSNTHPTVAFPAGRRNGSRRREWPDART
jgi:hypothetical protein